jgi:thiosulfate/3-mercaptopyruvate sulfurtransferase
MMKIKPIFLSLYLIIFVLVTTTSAMAFGNKFEKEVEKEKGAVKLVREVLKGGYDVVTVDELKKWMDQGEKMIVVDTMPYEKSYKKAHLPSAVSFVFPISEMKAWNENQTSLKSQNDYESMLGKDKEKPVVIYCGFVKCGRSHNGALWAKKMGYKNVYRFLGGIYAWKGANFEVESE